MAEVFQIGRDEAVAASGTYQRRRREYAGGKLTVRLASRYREEEMEINVGRDFQSNLQFPPNQGQIQSSECLRTSSPSVCRHSLLPRNLGFRHSLHAPMSNGSGPHCIPGIGGWIVGGGLCQHNDLGVTAIASVELTSNNNRKFLLLALLRFKHFYVTIIVHNERNTMLELCSERFAVI